MANVHIDKKSYTVDSLYQWDINQELVIYGLSLATIPEIHFTNDAMDKAIVRQATMDNAGVIRAEIPNSMLQKPYKIRAYVCIYEGDTFKSLYLITIPVNARSMPTDYTITVSDDEVYSFNALENKLENTLALSLARYEDANRKYNEAANVLAETVVKTTADKESAQASANSAANSAAVATGNANAAATSAAVAVENANSAISAKELAEESALLAVTNANNANTAKVGAETAANNAQAILQAIENKDLGGITKEQLEQLEQNSEDIASLTLGVHTDGLIYLFKGANPIGNGVQLPNNSGDVFGNVDSDNNIVLTGNLADGTYSIKYELENGNTIDIGNLILDTNIYYSVTNNLTNCTSGNNATKIVNGSSYSATITANSGYELSSIIVTMGGVNISSSAVSGSNITIANVTDNIVITAIAEEIVVEPTNLLPQAIFNTSEDAASSDKGYVSGYKISNSSGGLSQVTGCYSSGYIEVGINDTVTIKNITLRSDGNSNNIVLYSNTNKDSKIIGKPGPTGAFDSGVTVSNGVYSFTPSTWTTDASVAYFRFSCGGITDESIVTVSKAIG